MYNIVGKMTKCIQSLCNQTLHEIELLFIDDSSQDDSLEELGVLLNKYNKNNICYKIIKHDKNRGVAAARNSGVANASGEFIYYVDADDYIELNTLELLYKKAEEESAEIVGCEWLLTYTNSERRICQPDIHSTKDAYNKLTNGVMRWNLWLFLAKRSLYTENDINFIEGENMGEDMMVMLKLVLSANKICMIHEPLYHYVQTNTSSLTRNYMKYKSQLSSNIYEIEAFVAQRPDSNELLPQINKLKLATKLPLLISNNIKDYDEWNTWFPEANAIAESNYGVSTKTYLLQLAGKKKQYWFIKLYYWVVIRLILGTISK